MTSPTNNTKTNEFNLSNAVRTDCKLALAEVTDERVHPGLARVTYELDGSQAVLQGDVPTFYLKQLAQETASRINGVVRIVNRIEVKHAKVGGR